MNTESAQRTIRMDLEYDGSRYVGWQRQPNGLSIQEALEEALGEHLKHRTAVTASGRTDSGVHALGQVVSFRTKSEMPLVGIRHGTQALLPRGIAITHASEEAPGFDARRSARLRWYRYFLLLRETSPAVGTDFLTHVPGRLDLDRFVAASRLLAGKHNFAGFRASTCEAVRTELTLLPIQIAPLPGSILMLDFRSRSFLQNMVRILAGVMVAAARRKMSLSDIEAMLASGQRHHKATTLAPNGLFLYRVLYEGDVLPEDRAPSEILDTARLAI